MILEEIRKYIKRGPVSRYRISKDTGIDAAALAHKIWFFSGQVRAEDIQTYAVVGGIWRFSRRTIKAMFEKMLISRVGYFKNNQVQIMLRMSMLIYFRFGESTVSIEACDSDIRYLLIFSSRVFLLNGFAK